MVAMSRQYLSGADRVVQIGQAVLSIKRHNPDCATTKEKNAFLLRVSDLLYAHHFLVQTSCLSTSIANVYFINKYTDTGSHSSPLTLNIPISDVNSTFAGKFMQLGKSIRILVSVKCSQLVCCHIDHHLRHTSSIIR